jgi:hypothetical protein
MRLRELQLGSFFTGAFGRLCDVAPQLDTSVCRWKWAHFAHSFIFCTFRQVGSSILPGTPTLPDLIIDHRDLYEAALDDADDACKEGRLDVSKMEALVEALLAKQLARVYELAAGKTVMQPVGIPPGQA